MRSSTPCTSPGCEERAARPTNNITDSINAATGLQSPGIILAGTGTGSIYAGAPRTFVAGMRLAFR